jgi:prevent-host-death family protein
MVTPSTPVVINVHEAKTHLSRLLDRVRAGETIVLAKDGMPYARLVPLGPPAEGRRPGRAVGRVTDAFFDALPEDELLAWGQGGGSDAP